MTKNNVNEICVTCVMKCKQSAKVGVVFCKGYKFKKVGRKYETGRTEIGNEGVS